MTPDQKFVTYQNLTIKRTAGFSPEKAEQTAINILAETAYTKKGGKILTWSQFNENPDPLLNLLLANIIVSQIKPDIFKNLTAWQVAVLAIENSAGYFADRIGDVISWKYNYDRYPRIIRARKTDRAGVPPSPATGDVSATASVIPITSEGVPRHLIATCSPIDQQLLKKTKVLVAVDDFLATQATIAGGVDIGSSLLAQAGAGMKDLIVIPVAGLGKPEQKTEVAFNTHGAILHDIITALDVKFWPDHKHNQVMIQANGYEAMVMTNANVANFTE